MLSKSLIQFSVDGFPPCYLLGANSWEICMQVRKQQLEVDMEQQTGSK